MITNSVIFEKDRVVFMAVEVKSNDGLKPEDSKGDSEESKDTNLLLPPGARFRRKRRPSFSSDQPFNIKERIDIATSGGEECCGPGYASPMHAFNSGAREKFMYTTCLYGSSGIQAPDYLATVDIDPESPTFCQVVHRLEMPIIGDELHQSGWNACSSCYDDASMTRRYLILPALHSSNIYIVDTQKVDAPTMHKVITGEDIKEKYNLSVPHTAHCLASGDVMISCVGDGEMKSHCEFLMLNIYNDFELAGTWSKDGKGCEQGLDFWYQPRHNVMVSGTLGDPSVFSQGLYTKDKEFYGTKLVFWDWTEREIIQTIDLGDIGRSPLELRFLHNPDSVHGFVVCLIGGSLFHFWRDEDSSEWKAAPVDTIAPIKVENYAVEEVPALLCDTVISLDDKYIYFGSWLHGFIRQYDITDPFQPKLTGQVDIGGIFRDCYDIKPLSDDVQMKPVQEIKGIKLNGGPEKLQLSFDGKRLYVTSSFYSPWDKQFYPSMAAQGGKLLMCDVDTENGGLTLNGHFIVDFSDEPNGPSSVHDVRYPGGDCTSDIWL